MEIGAQRDYELQRIITKFAYMLEIKKGLREKQQMVYFSKWVNLHFKFKY